LRLILFEGNAFCFDRRIAEVKAELPALPSELAAEQIEKRLLTVHITGASPRKSNLRRWRSPQREPNGYLRLTFSRSRQLLSHAFPVLGPRGLVLAGFQGAGMSLAALLVARLAAVAWLGRSKLGG
jgi:hypothetical protein